jgi:hypothetical protein
MLTFDDFLAQAWDDHADHPQAVAARLPQALQLAFLGTLEERLGV